MPKRQGGAVAETGFGFQDNMVLFNIPGWLRMDAFTSIIREASCDYEARFFNPTRYGLQIVGVECKGYTVSFSDFWKEIDDFRELDEQNPGAYSRFLFQCAGVDGKLKPILVALQRIRGAWPFYDAGAPNIQKDSYNEFEARVLKAKRSIDQARFLFERVDVDFQLSTDERAGISKFVDQLQVNFPILARTPAGDLHVAALRVRDLLKSRKAEHVLRNELEEAIWGDMLEQARPDQSRLTIFTSHDDASWAGADPKCLVSDWRSFFGGSERHYPAPEAWAAGPLRELAACRDWIEEQGRPRRLLIKGSRRNSSEFAVGSVFRSAAGFVLCKEQKDGIWSTDEHASADTPAYNWNITFPSQTTAAELAVAIVVLGENSICESFVTALRKGTDREIALLGLSSSHPFVSAAHVNRAVQGAKNEILRALSSTGARIVRLYLWGPAVLALFLGHRFNVEAQVICYEKDGSGRYVPTWQLQ